jgi:hypothetical protein
VHVYEVRPRKDKRGVDLISDALPFGRLWYGEIPHAIGYAKFRSRSHHAVIRVYDEAGNVIETRAGGRVPRAIGEQRPIRLTGSKFTQIPFGRSGAAIKLSEHGQRRF